MFRLQIPAFGLSLPFTFYPLRMVLIDTTAHRGKYQDLYLSLILKNASIVVVPSVVVQSVKMKNGLRLCLLHVMINVPDFNYNLMIFCHLLFNIPPIGHRNDHSKGVLGSISVTCCTSKLEQLKRN